METTKESTNVEVPMTLVNRIKALVSSRLGYQTMAEYVRQSIREKLAHDEYELERMKERESQLDDEAKSRLNIE